MTEELEEKPLGVEDDDTDDAAALIAEVQTNEKGDKYVGLGTHISLRKEAKQQKREIAELKAKNAEFTGLQEKVNQLAHISEAVEKDKTLLAEIDAAIAGTRKTKTATAQPQDDAQGRAFAEAMGFLTEAGEIDAARGRRALDLQADAIEQRMKPQIDKANETAFGLRGEQNLTAMYGLTTKDGDPLATEESIRETLKEGQVPMHMLADPRVAKTVARLAAGLDRELGRSPKAPIEPIYFERGDNRRREPAISDAERRLAQRLGVSDAELAATSKLTPNKRGEIDLE